VVSIDITTVIVTSPGLLGVMLFYDTSVLQDLAAFIFRVKRMVLRKGHMIIGLGCKRGAESGSQ
jgi:hypothetical protein